MNETIKLIHPFIAPFFTLLGVSITLFYQSRIMKENFQNERFKLNHGDNEKRRWLVRERLEKMHLILGEISREFSLTFLTIDWEKKLSVLTIMKNIDLCVSSLRKFK